MKIYWSYSQIPELADLPSSVRKQLVRGAWARARGRWQVWVIAVLAYFLCQLVVAPLLGIDSSLGAAIGGGMLGLVMYVAAVHEIRKGGNSTR